MQFSKVAVDLPLPQFANPNAFVAVDDQFAIVVFTRLGMPAVRLRRPESKVTVATSGEYPTVALDHFIELVAWQPGVGEICCLGQKESWLQGSVVKNEHHVLDLSGPGKGAAAGPIIWGGFGPKYWMGGKADRIWPQRCLPDGLLIATVARPIVLGRAEHGSQRRQILVVIDVRKPLAETRTKPQVEPSKNAWPVPLHLRAAGPARVGKPLIGITLSCQVSGTGKEDVVVLRPTAHRVDSWLVRPILEVEHALSGMVEQLVAEGTGIGVLVEQAKDTLHGEVGAVLPSIDVQEVAVDGSFPDRQSTLGKNHLAPGTARWTPNRMIQKGLAPDGEIGRKRLLREGFFRSRFRSLLGVNLWWGGLGTFLMLLLPRLPVIGH